MLQVHQKQTMTYWKFQQRRYIARKKLKSTILHVEKITNDGSTESHLSAMETYASWLQDE